MSAPKFHYFGNLFDGKSSAKQRVEIDLSSMGISLKFPNRQRLTWKFASIRWNPASDKKNPPFHLDHRADENRVETLVVDDPYFLENFRRLAPDSLDSHWDRLPWMRPLAIVAGLLLVPIFVYVLWNFAIPSIADKVAMRVPVEWEDKLGEVVLQGLIADSKKDPDPKLQQAVDKIVQRLLTANPDQPYKIRVYILPDETINALALPGGSLIVFQGLLDVAESPEELAGVLAHEIQHVVLRHSTRAIIRTLASEVLITLMVGDVNGMMQGIIDVAGELNGLRHSRKMESQADQKGMEMILGAGIDPMKMVRMFEKLTDEEEKVWAQVREAVGSDDESASWFNYFSTHPAGEDRIGILKKQIGKEPASGYSPILPGIDWKRLAHTRKKE